MSIEENLRKWIDSQGYPLEMRTADKLRRAGLWWDHGRVYTDPVTRKVREIDLTADLASDDSRSVQAVFECKHVGKDRPWVLFATEQTPLNELGFVMQAICTGPMRELLAPAAADSRVQGLAFFVKPELVGFNLVVSHGDNQDAAFHAVHTVVNGASELARRHDGYGHTILYIPVVVIDTPLYTCALPEGSDYELERVERATLLQPTGEGDRRVVQIVSVEGLDEFIEAASTGAEKLLEVLGGRSASST